jgi:rhodanese-related sulfurtransferase
MKAHLQQMLEEISRGEAQLLDVREQDEWEAGHLKITKLVPLSGLRMMEEPDSSISRSKKTYIHCRSGQRVLSAAPILEDLGFQEVIPLAEGFSELASEGLEVQ